MRRLAARALLPLLALVGVGRATAADAPPPAITVVTCEFINNGGLEAIAPAFTAETGIVVHVAITPMSQIADRAIAGPTDAMFMPADLMDRVNAAGAMRAGSRRRVGRAYMGLAVRKGSAIPDISTVPKFIAVLESANLVLHSNAASGTSRTAKLITDLLARPAFAHVRHRASLYGEGGAALARNEGDMAIQNISQILLWDNLQVVGRVPEELGLYQDGVGAVSARTANAAAAQRFVDYATQKGLFALWYSRGVDQRKGAL